MHRRLAGCRHTSEPNIFWVWVTRDPCLIASPEISHVACAITITIPEIVQIVGPDLHHILALLKKLRPVVGAPEWISYFVCQLMLYKFWSKAKLLVEDGSCGRSKAMSTHFIFWNTQTPKGS